MPLIIRVKISSGVPNLKEIKMSKFLVIGNKRIYKMETLDIRTAWELAEKEMNNYKLTGNTKIIDIIRKDSK